MKEFGPLTVSADSQSRNCFEPIAPQPHLFRGSLKSPVELQAMRSSSNGTGFGWPSA